MKFDAVTITRNLVLVDPEGREPDVTVATFSFEIVPTLTTLTVNVECTVDGKAVTKDNPSALGERLETAVRSVAQRSGHTLLREPSA